MYLITRKLRFCVYLIAFLKDIIPIVLSCLTYDISKGNLTLNCRVDDTATTITIIDNKNSTHALFDFKNPCQVYALGSTCIANISQREIILSVENFDAQLSGVWTCVTEHNQYTTKVSDLEGLANETKVSIFGVLNDKTSVNITCSSCIAPYTSSAEFLIDHRSVDTITYDNGENVCFNKDNSCTKGVVCSCLPLQNTFSRVFEINATASKYVFSCYMKFKGGDADDGIIFGKTSSITLIDKKFLKEESETIILNQWSKHGQLPETTPASAYTEITLKETLSRLILMIAVPIFALAFIIGIIFCVCRKKKNDKNDTCTLIPLQTLNSPNDATSTNNQCHHKTESKKHPASSGDLPYL